MLSFINNSNNLGVVSDVSENFFNWFDDGRKDSPEATNHGQNVRATDSDRGSCSSTFSSEELESEDDNALASLAKSLQNETEASGEVFDVLGAAEESSQESLTESSIENSHSDEEVAEAKLLQSLLELEAKSGFKELCTSPVNKLQQACVGRSLVKESDANSSSDCEELPDPESRGVEEVDHEGLERSKKTEHTSAVKTDLARKEEIFEELARAKVARLVCREQFVQTEVNVSGESVMLEYPREVESYFASQEEKRDWDSIESSRKTRCQLLETVEEGTQLPYSSVPRGGLRW